MKQIYKYVLNAGTLGGLALFAIFLLLQSLALSPLLSYRFLAAWIPVVCIIWAVKKTKQHVFKGKINFGRAFYMGMTTSFIVGSLKGMLVYIFMQFYGADVIAVFQQNLTDLMQMDGGDAISSMLPEEVKDFTKHAANFTPGNVAFNEFGNNVFWGLIIAVIVALVVKNSKIDPLREEFGNS